MVNIRSPGMQLLASGTVTDTFQQCLTACLINVGNFLVPATHCILTEIKTKSVMV